jgi:hypothetical protein
MYPVLLKRKGNKEMMRLILNTNIENGGASIVYRRKRTLLPYMVGEDKNWEGLQRNTYW